VVTGLFATSKPATGYFSGIAVDLSSVDVATVKDVMMPAPATPSFLNSFTAPGYGNLFFDLTGSLGPVAPACTGAEGIDQACSFGSLTLKNTQAGLVIDFAVAGFFQDSNLVVSRAAGTDLYTSQRVTDTVSAFIQNLGNSGSGSAAYSANYSTGDGITFPNEVPEPSSAVFLGIGATLLFVWN